ncbi:hypothetical protein D3C72_1680820 [compost metagenome]
MVLNRMHRVDIWFQQHFIGESMNYCFRYTEFFLAGVNKYHISRLNTVASDIVDLSINTSERYSIPKCRALHLQEVGNGNYWDIVLVIVTWLAAIIPMDLFTIRNMNRFNIDDTH